MAQSYHYYLDESVPKADIAEWVGRFLNDFCIRMKREDHEHLEALINGEDDPVKRAASIRQWYNSLIENRL